MRSITAKRKIMLIVTGILLLLLVAVTIAYACQGVAVRVTLSEETLIRNGQSAAISFGDGEGNWHTVQAFNPIDSIYEYIVEVSGSIWSESTQARIEFSQVRRGDQILIEEIAVKQPFFQERTAESGIECEGLYDLSMDAARERGALGIAYPLFVLAVVAVWAVAVFLIPREAYALLGEKLRMFCDAVKSFSAMDAAIAALGVAAIVVYNFSGSGYVSDYYHHHFGYSFSDSLLFENSGFAYSLLSVIVILFIVVKVISAKRESAPQSLRDLGDCGSEARVTRLSVKHGITRVTRLANYQSVRKWLPYLLLLVLAIIAYAPALMANPYYHNDEGASITAAIGYLEHGDYSVYSRAWPYTWIVAQMIKFFGFTVLSTRLPSAILGVIFILSVFYVVKRITNRTSIAFLSCAFILSNPFLTYYFTIVRMYALMLPISLWMFYFMYMTLHAEITYKSDNAATRFVKKHFNFHFGYAAVTMPLIWLNYQIHQNSMMLVACAAAYVFLAAIVRKERKFINLSIIGLLLVASSVVGYVLHTKTDIVVPEIFRIIGRFVGLTEFGQYNYDYYINDVSMPLGVLLGTFFMLSGLIVCMRKGKENSFLAYAALSYVLTVVFFVFFADRYYAYNYMMFIVPVSAMIILLGCHALTSRTEASTRVAVYSVVIVAVIAQVVNSFPVVYAGSPDRAKFDRPYQIMANDAKNEELSTISLCSTTLTAQIHFMQMIESEKHFVRMRGVDVWGRGQAGQIDRLLAESEQPVMYFLYELEKRFHISESFWELLQTAVDHMVDIDATSLYKYHFIEAAVVSEATGVGGVAEVGGAGEQGDRAGRSDAFRTIGVIWEGDVAYLYCEMSYVPEFSEAVFIGVEVVEQGLSQSATHRYQILAPEGFGQGDELRFILPVRPKTEEHSEDIVFVVTDSAYIYYGEDVAAVVGLAG